jgi:hypothetical protein
VADVGCCSAIELTDMYGCREHERVFMLHEVDEAAAVTRWKLADVRVNREAQGETTVHEHARMALG